MHFLTTTYSKLFIFRPLICLTSAKRYSGGFAHHLFYIFIYSTVRVCLNAEVPALTRRNFLARDNDNAKSW